MKFKCQILGAKCIVATNQIIGGPRPPPITPHDCVIVYA